MNLRINSRGKLVETPNVGRVILPTWEVYQSPTIRIDDVKQRRFSLIDRKVPKVK